MQNLEKNKSLKRWCNEGIALAREESSKLQLSQVILNNECSNTRSKCSFKVLHQKAEATCEVEPCIQVVAIAADEHTRRRWTGQATWTLQVSLVPTIAGKLDSNRSPRQTQSTAASTPINRIYSLACTHSLTKCKRATQSATQRKDRAARATCPWFWSCQTWWPSARLVRRELGRARSLLAKLIEAMEWLAEITIKTTFTFDRNGRNND